MASTYTGVLAYTNTTTDTLDQKSPVYKVVCLADNSSVPGFFKLSLWTVTLTDLTQPSYLLLSTLLIPLGVM